ncbi:hypothetical protein IPH25_01480 [bacterium]|nr:MAG: hypothetical protein IPG37_03610 [bacterium]QQR62098.1 MAG: hypothetical protein IPH25_01480 [bacterium]QQR63345.1 MAG: hypothetical protein IPH67_02640 [bacterium]
MITVTRLLFFVSLYLPLLTYTKLETLEAIEHYLHQKTQIALEKLMAAFPNVPRQEWDKTFERIKKIKELVTADLAIPNKSEGVSDGSVFPNDTPYVYENLPAQIKKCLADRGINPEKVLLEFGPSYFAAAAATKSNYVYENDTLKSHQAFIWVPQKELFDDEFGHRIYHGLWWHILSFRLLQFKFDLLTNAKRFHLIEWIIQHEITHINQMHSIIETEVLNTIRKYYAMTAIEITQVYLDYTKTDEYVAYLVPCILYPNLAKAALQYVSIVKFAENLFKKMRLDWAIKPAYSVTHPTDSQLYPFLKKIVAIHEKNGRYKKEKNVAEKIMKRTGNKWVMINTLFSGISLAFGFGYYFTLKYLLHNSKCSS